MFISLREALQNIESVRNNSFSIYVRIRKILHDEKVNLFIKTGVRSYLT